MSLSLSAFPCVTLLNGLLLDTHAYKLVWHGSGSPCGHTDMGPDSGTILMNSLLKL